MPSRSFLFYPNRTPRPTGLDCNQSVTTNRAKICYSIVRRMGQGYLSLHFYNRICSSIYLRMLSDNHSNVTSQIYNLTR